MPHDISAPLVLTSPLPDLSPSHVLVSIPDTSSSAHLLPADEEILKRLGPVDKMPVPAKGDRRPAYLVKPASFAQLPFSSVQRVRIISFTDAFKWGPGALPLSSLRCPSSITPPEFLMDKNDWLIKSSKTPNERVDNWQLGCLIFRLHTGEFPFGVPDSWSKLATSIAQFAPSVPSGPLMVRKELEKHESNNPKTVFPGAGPDSGPVFAHRDPAGHPMAINQRFPELQRHKVSDKHTEHLANILHKLLWRDPGSRMPMFIAVPYLRELRDAKPDEPAVLDQASRQAVQPAAAAAELPLLRARDTLDLVPSRVLASFTPSVPRSPAPPRPSHLESSPADHARRRELFKFLEEDDPDNDGDNESPRADDVKDLIVLEAAIKIRRRLDEQNFQIQALAGSDK